MPDERIKNVAVRTHGGYAGVDEVVDIDLTKLDPATRKQIEQALESANFSSQSGSGEEATGFDLLQHEVTVTTEDGQQRVRKFVNTGGGETAFLPGLIEMLRKAGG